MTDVTRTQRRLSLGLLAALALTFLGVGLLAHFSPVIPRYVEEQIRRHQEINGVYVYAGEYADTGDYVLTGLLPEADYSRGGVYFFGASNMIVSLMPWKLPPGERALIHNYSMGAFTHRETHYFVKNLVEEQGFLQAGGDKVTVVLGLHIGLFRDDQKEFDVFRRYGSYRFDPATGLHLNPAGPVMQFLRRERIYANQFLRIVTLRPSQIRIPFVQNPPAHQEAWRRVMGPRWRENLQMQTGHLAALLDYLQQRNVRIHVVFTPYPSWQDELPFPAAYRAAVMPLLESHKIPITDLAHLLPDEDFTDASHSRYTGQLKIHEICRELAMRALADMGMWPPAQTNR